MRLPKSRETEERMIEESESPIHDPLPMKIIFNLFLVHVHVKVDHASHGNNRQK